MRITKIFITLGSLLPTPILIFISSALPIYFINQSELNYQFSVLAPFLYGAGAVLIIGVTIFQFKQSHFKSALIWLYYLTGPFLIANSIMRAIPGLQKIELISIIFVSSVFFICFIIFTIKFDFRKAEGLFAFFGLLMMIQISYSLFVNLKFQQDSEAPAELSSGRKIEKHQLPNIYHLILDGYQTDFFEMQLQESFEKELSGFNYYPKASALYSHTNWSIPSIFLGEEYISAESDLDYQRRAFNGKESFLSSLKMTGYTTVAITRKFYPFSFNLFDQTIYHSKNTRHIAIDNTDSFIALWIYRVLPRFMVEFFVRNEFFIDLETYENLENKTLLTDSAPQESMLSYQNFLNKEQHLSRRGRYTYLHLMLPHSPYVYSADCVETGNATIEEQSQCASNLLLDLISELKRLDRFNNSLIIVNADHGAPYSIKDGLWLKSKEGRSHRSLLLVKPVNNDSSHAFKRYNYKVSIGDIATGIRQFAKQLSGSSVAPPWWRLNQNSKGRNIYFYRVKSSKQIMRKYLVTDDHDLKFVNEMKFVVNDVTNKEKRLPPIFPVNKILEAENGLLSEATEVDNDLPDTNGNYVVFGTKSYRFKLKKDSNINLKIRAITPNGNSNSTYLRINNSPRKIWSLSQRKEWKWHKYDSTWNLKKGIHTITLEYREPIYIDQLKLSVSS